MESQASFSMNYTLLPELYSDSVKKGLLADVILLSTLKKLKYTTVLPAKSDSGIMFCLQSYQGLMINRSVVY